MNKSVIVYGPAGCGKTRFAERIRKHLGLDHIADDVLPVDIGKAPAMGFLILVTSNPPAGSGMFRCVSFDEVAQEINAEIPKTDWQDGTPQLPGVYELKGLPYPFHKWDGKIFDHPAPAIEEGNFDRECNGHVYHMGVCAGTPWRGLAEEPLPVKGGTE